MTKNMVQPYRRAAYAWLLAYSFFTACLQPVQLHAQQARNLLTGRYDKTTLEKQVSITGIQAIYPAYTERKKWEGINPVYRQALIAAGEGELNYTWQTVPASVYLEFLKTGNRYVMEDIFNRNITAIKRLAFAELAEGKGRFLPQLVNGVWAVCEITSWSLSASLNLQKAGPGLPDVEEPIIELGTGITANVMAWVYYLFKEPFQQYNPMVNRRIKYEINRRVLQPYYLRNDFWWMDLDGQPRMVNNWNVWLNYNALTCMLLVEEDAGRQYAGIYKSMQSADRFINYYKADGACEEGPAYWSHAGGMLFNYLALLQTATNDKVNIFQQPLIKNIASYICKAYIDSSWYLNYADAGAKLSPDPGIVYYFGKATGDTTLSGFGAYLARLQGWEKTISIESMYATLQHIFYADELLKTPPSPPYLVSSWMKETGIAVARDNAGTAKGFYFSALAGNNGESHNHNDVGSCVLFYNGQPLLVDIGSETYTSKTFGPERYSIWTMQSLYHNLPVINGTEQKEGVAYAARNTSFADDGKTAMFSTDIAAAYPSVAAVKQWQRSYQLKRHQSFTITDEYILTADKGSTELHFMTPALLRQKREGQIQLVSGAVTMNLYYNPKQLQPTIETIPVTDKRLLQSWPPVLYRLVFLVRKTGTRGKHSLQFRPAS